MIARHFVISGSNLEIKFQTVVSAWQRYLVLYKRSVVSGNLIEQILAKD